MKCSNANRGCEWVGTVGAIEKHVATCGFALVPCPNDGCDTEIQRLQVGEHVSKCPHAITPCKYKGIGCDTELKREDMAAHEQNDKLHLHMALDAVISLQAAVETLQVEVYSQHDRLMMMKNDSGAFRLSEYQKRKIPTLLHPS